MTRERIASRSRDRQRFGSRARPLLRGRRTSPDRDARHARQDCELSSRWQGQLPFVAEALDVGLVRRQDFIENRHFVPFFGRNRISTTAH